MCWVKYLKRYLDLLQDWKSRTFDTILYKISLVNLPMTSQCVPRVNSSPRSTRPPVNSPGSTRPVSICMEDVTLTPAYLSCEFAFRAHFQCVVRTYNLKCVEKTRNSSFQSKARFINIHTCMCWKALMR